MFKKYRPEDKLKSGIQNILFRLIDEYGFNILVLENGWFRQSKSPFFQAVFQGIVESAKQRKLSLYTYSPKTIRKQICNNGKATKRKAAIKLTRKYPDLTIYLEQNYWLHAFDALGAAQTYITKYQDK